MTVVKRLERLSRAFLPPAGARLAKRVAVWPRYAAQAAACRRGFREFGDRYPEKILFVAGLPKSGTTWLEKMISSWPGFHELLIPEVASYEMKTGGSNDYELPSGMFDRMKNMLVLTKMHVHGSEHNARVLADADVPYIVIHRDPRDAAVSHVFYVRNTPWHAEHPLYAGKDMEASLVLFAERSLPGVVEWVRSWERNRSGERSDMFRYEDMLADTVGCLRRAAAVFKLDADEARLREIADRNSFSAMSGGRQRGQSDDGQFVRKGVSGDWRNHFTPAVCDAFKDRAGEFLVEFGFESDLNWSLE